MELKHKIIQFDYYNNGVKIGSSIIENEITEKEFIDTSFPFRQIIGFLDSSNSYVKVDLMGNFEETKIKNLSSRNFSISTLVDLSKVFNLQLVKSNLGIANLKILPNGRVASAALKTCSKVSILTIYSLELPDLYRGAGVFDGKLYIHGIWEINNTEITNTSWLSDF